MRTIEKLRARCKVDEDGCWIWQGAYSKPKANPWPAIYAPDFTRDQSGATMTTQLGKRAVWHIVTGKPIADGHEVWSSCHKSGCVSPKCLRCGTRDERYAAISASGIMKHANNARMAAGHKLVIEKNRERFGMSQERVDAILAHPDLSLTKLAKMVGVHKKTVWSVRTGRSGPHRKLTGNHWAQLMI